MGSFPKIPATLERLFSPTSRLTREGRARRRFNCSKQTEWDDRAETAIALLMDHRDSWLPQPQQSLTVADFGAGNERLRPLLESHVEIDYHPYDLHPQLPTTQRLDVSQGLPDRTFDIAICLGLLEYLPSIPKLAHELHNSCRFALVSYVTSDSPVAIPREDRLNHGWTNHLTASEIETAFATAGFRLLDTLTSDAEATKLWFWRAGC